MCQYQGSRSTSQEPGFILPKLPKSSRSPPLCKQEDRGWGEPSSLPEATPSGRGRCPRSQHRQHPCPPSFLACLQACMSSNSRPRDTCSAAGAHELHVIPASATVTELGVCSEKFGLCLPGAKQPSASRKQKKTLAEASSGDHGGG